MQNKQRDYFQIVMISNLFNTINDKAAVENPMSFLLFIGSFCWRRKTVRAKLLMIIVGNCLFIVSLAKLDTVFLFATIFTWIQMIYWFYN